MKMKTCSTIAIISVFMFAGCVSPMQKEPEPVVEQKIWPDPYIEGTGGELFYAPPATLYTIEKADSIIQNTQPQISQNRNGTAVRAANIIVDKEAIKILWKWTETVTDVSQTDTYRNPTQEEALTDVFMGKDVSGRQTGYNKSFTSRAIEQTDKTIIPFEDISSLRLLSTTGMLIDLKSGQNIPINVDNEYYCRKFIDAVYSAMRARGYDTKLRWGLVCQHAAMTAEQMADSTVQKGVVVTGVRKDSAAQAAALMYKDIIQKFNGTPVNSYSDLETCLQNCKKGKIYSMEIIRWTRSGETVSKKTLVVKITPQ